MPLILFNICRTQAAFTKLTLEKREVVEQGARVEGQRKVFTFKRSS